MVIKVIRYYYELDLFKNIAINDLIQKQILNVHYQGSYLMITIKKW